PLDDGDVGAELRGGEGGLVPAGSAAEYGDALGALKFVGHRTILAQLSAGATRAAWLRRWSGDQMRVVGMTGTHENPVEDPTVDPFAVAKQAAEQLAEKTGVERHDIALTLGSGWAKAADLIGETTATIPATDIVGFSKPALEGHVGTLRSVLLPGGKRALVIGART